jgi:hypothetical protein
MIHIQRRKQKSMKEEMVRKLFPLIVFCLRKSIIHRSERHGLRFKYRVLATYIVRLIIYVSF